MRRLPLNIVLLVYVSVVVTVVLLMLTFGGNR